MDSAIKAIDTIYEGYRFRSRLEARWAVFFDSVGWRWSYEAEGYTFPDGTCYLPDFYLLDYGLFIEIKGQEPTEKECAKAINMKKGGKSVLIIVGPPWEVENFHHAIGSDMGFPLVSLIINVAGESMHKCISTAQLNAKQARFEFGENGSPRSV
jgi:hypothetical protein